eukprot:768279-Hanusia_phi.AAC.5
MDETIRLSNCRARRAEPAVVSLPCRLLNTCKVTSAHPRAQLVVAAFDLTKMDPRERFLGEVVLNIIKLLTIQRAVC